MSLTALPNASDARRILFLISRRGVAFIVLCLGLTIGAAAQGPVCAFGLSPANGTAPLLVTANGGCTDVTSQITSETLDWGDGSPPVSIPPPSFAVFSIQHTYTAAGTFTVTLTAVDALGAQNTVTQQEVVTVNSVPSCTLTVTPTSGTAPLNVNASGSCTDAGNDITSEVIGWGDGSTTQGTSGPHTYNTPGPFTVILTASDAAGNTGSSPGQTVTVTSPPPSCTLQVSPTSGPAPLAVTATGSCTDLDNDITSTVLNWSDGTASNGTSGTHTFTAAGTYVVTLTATDAAHNTGKASQTVTVGNGHNQPPQCSMSASPVSGQVPLAVTVNPNCSDPENDITSIMIDFGDGFYASIPPNSNASHTYTRAGSFKVVVTASDVARNVSTPSSQTVGTSDTPTMFIGGNGQVKQFDESGHSLKTLSPNQSGSMTGMAFDWLDSLYVTDFSADAISKFDGNGTLAGNFGSSYNCKPESIVFDSSGNAYVGETGCSHALLKFDAYGNLAAAYSVSTETEGSDWIDLASDQCTVYYTSQGTTVFRFNACTGQQQPPFAKSLTTGLAVKILPDKSVLVADKGDIVHFDASGQAIGKYTAAGETCLVSLALDPDGKSFWAVDYCSSDVVHFDISSGSQLAKFNSGSPAQTTYGIGMRGPVPQITPAGPLVASPQSATITAGQTASFNLAFVPSGSAANQMFTFSCANLPVGAACQFSPQTATVTSAGITVRVTITSTAARAAENWSQFPPSRLAWWTLLPGVFFLADSRVARCRSRKWKWVGVVLVLMWVVSLVACSASNRGSGGNSAGGGNSAPTASSTTPASNYAVVLHATSGALQSSTVANLTVQ
jgi:PKD repeat protein